MLQGLQISHDALDFLGRLPMGHRVIVTVPIELVTPDRHVTGLVRVFLSLAIDELIDLVGAKFSTVPNSDGREIRNPHVQERRDRSVAASVGTMAGGAGCGEYLSTRLRASHAALPRARCDGKGYHSRDEHERQHSQPVSHDMTLSTGMPGSVEGECRDGYTQLPICGCA
jgi:hypothetical protein